MKPFPIPVVALGPGSQDEDESLDYLPMPTAMDTYRPPMLPEPEDVAACVAARGALTRTLDLLLRAAETGVGGQVSLNQLPPSDIRLVNQVLGEGEASAIVRDDDATLEVRVQESVFAGVWRVVTRKGDAVIDDAVEVGAVPQLLRSVAEEDARQPVAHWSAALPPNVQNAPHLVEEIRDQVRLWSKGQPPHVVNLSLLPVSPEDIAFLDHELGTGRVLLLSRGYGNCRISNTRLPNCWRVVYYNSMDKVILNTVEVIDMPEVAMAAPEDLADSEVRLRDVLVYLEAV